MIPTLFAEEQNRYMDERFSQSVWRGESISMTPRVGDVIVFEEARGGVAMVLGINTPFRGQMTVRYYPLGEKWNNTTAKVKIVPYEKCQLYWNRKNTGWSDTGIKKGPDQPSMLVIKPEEFDDMKCCGNCKNKPSSGSLGVMKPYNVCSRWEFDNLTAEQRKQ